MPAAIRRLRAFQIGLSLSAIVARAQAV